MTRPRRRNADNRLRELERAFEAGDAGAGRELAAMLNRQGLLTVQWVARLGPLAAEVVDPAVAEAVGYAFTVDGSPGSRGAFGQMLGGNNWFPAHNSVEVCPRGHRPSVDGTWSNLTPEAAVRTVSGFHEGMLTVWSEYDEHSELDLALPGEFFVCEAWTDLSGRAAHYNALTNEERLMCLAVWHVRPPVDRQIDFA